MPRYKTPTLQKVYDVMLTLAADKNSELYYNGKPHRGANVRCAFWDGYRGNKPTLWPVGTIVRAAFEAGRVYAKREPGITDTGYQRFK